MISELKPTFEPFGDGASLKDKGVRLLKILTYPSVCPPRQGTRASLCGRSSQIGIDSISLIFLACFCDIFAKFVFCLHESCL